LGGCGCRGTPSFVEATATREDLRLLQDEQSLEFISYADDEIIARTDGLHLRWTPDTGAEIIAQTARRDAFDALFCGTWLNARDVTGPADLPTPVLARLGTPQAGTIEARHAGEPVAAPYFAGVFDYWTPDEQDTVDSAKVPGYDRFMDHAEAHADPLILTGDAAYALFDGLMLGLRSPARSTPRSNRTSSTGFPMPGSPCAERPLCNGRPRRSCKNTASRSPALPTAAPTPARSSSACRRALRAFTGRDA
jgi:hypothetical protein